MRSLLTLLFFIGLSAGGYSQTPLIDSLRRELPKSKPDSIKVHDRIRISWYLRDGGDSADAWKYAWEGDSIAKKTGNPVLKGIMLEHFGFLHHRMNSKRAISFFLEAESILKSYPHSLAARKSMASIALQAGYEHFKIEDDIGALGFFFEGIKRYEALDSNHYNLPVLYGNIINSYFNLKRYELALEYCQKGEAKLKYANRPDASMGLYINYARVLNKLGRKPESENYFKLAKHWADSFKSDHYLAKYYQVKALLQESEGKAEEAFVLLKAGLPHVEVAGAASDIASYYNWLSIVCNAREQFREAAGWIEKARQLCTQYGLSYLLKDNYWNRSKMEKGLGQYEAAYHSLDSFFLLNDSLINLQNAERIEFMDARYQGEKKEAKIVELAAENEIKELALTRRRNMILLLIAAIAGLVGVTMLLVKNYRQRQKLQQQLIAELEAEKQLAATRSVMKGEEQERTRLARDLHDGLGGILSGIKYSLNNMKGNLVMTPENAEAFERSMDLLDNSIKEMRRVAHNMMPEALVKFGLDTALRDFCRDISQSGALQVNYQSVGLKDITLDQTRSITVYRIIQELVNNIIRHAAAKQAIVQLSESNGEISITVEDDGKGFDVNMLDRSKGIGWTNIQSRVEYLKGKLDIRSNPGQGSSVMIEFSVL